MTIVTDDQQQDVDLDEAVAAAGPGGFEAEAAEPAAPDQAPVEEPWEAPPLRRPLLVAGLGTLSAALMTGGIFGSWSARGLCVAATVFGLAWAAFILRSPNRQVLKQALLLPVTIAVASLLVSMSGASSSPLAVMSKAIKSGRLLQPPVPFDPGWRPILFSMFVILGFASAWVAASMRRPQAALAVPIPIVALTAITQPSGDKVIAGILGLVPLLAAVGVLFGADGQGPELGRQFELKRLIRGVAVGIPLIVLLVVLSSSSFLFPKPVYNPQQKPQKPKPIPISAAADRVLFEIASTNGGDPPITGPWRTGVLDVYDGSDWRLAPFDPKRFKPVPSSGIVDNQRPGTIDVRFTVRDLGDQGVYPTVATPARGQFSGGDATLFDPRTGVFRVKAGRIKPGTIYTLSLPAYPTSTQLQAASSSSYPKDIKPFLAIGSPPASVHELLAQAPQNPWLRLNFLRNKLNSVVVASGAGIPGPMKAAKVDQLLIGNHEGTPFEIVAAEAMLARWAGVPSRIGFGFDAGQKEGNVTTIRPKNSAQFLEVWFQGYGWVPVISAPPKAKTSFDTDKNKQFDPTIAPSDDVAVNLEIPIELETLTQLYQRIRHVVLVALPFVLAVIVIYMALPSLYRARRRTLRRRWAQGQGVVAQVAVEYAELRDLTTDLSVGDPYDTPLEFLDRLIDDDEHAEFAWLVSRLLYGDMKGTATQQDAQAAIRMGESLRSRLSKGQPMQSRFLALISRASLHEPFSSEIPNVRMLRLRRRPKPKAAARGGRGTTGGGLGGWLGRRMPGGRGPRGRPVGERERRLVSTGGRS